MYSILNMETLNRYTPAEILAIFQVNYLQQQEFDPEVDLGEELTFNTTIAEWINICDLVEPRKLGEYFNYLFELNISIEKWSSILLPRNIRNLKELCDFISLNAIKPLIKPVKLLGSECESAATFRYLLERFKEKGIEVKDIKPSSLLEPFAKDYLGIFIEEVNKVNPSTLPPVVYKSNYLYRLGVIFFAVAFFLMITSIWISDLIWVYLSSICIGMLFCWIGSKYKPRQASFNEIVTFRDLITKIQNKNI